MKQIMTALIVTMSMVLTAQAEQRIALNEDQAKLIAVGHATTAYADADARLASNGGSVAAYQAGLAVHDFGLYTVTVKRTVLEKTCELDITINEMTGAQVGEIAESCL